MPKIPYETGRRAFIRDAAAAGLLGTVGVTPGLVSPTEAAQQAGVQDPEKPAGLRPLAQLDCRFPVSYEASVPESVRLVTQYFKALSQRDLQGMAQTLHYPFVTYEGIDPVVIGSEQDLIAHPPPSMNVTGKGDHLIRNGAYDMMEGIEVHIFNAIGAGLTLDYTRYTADGQQILACNGVYGVTNNDGKWGIEYISTIFSPPDQLGDTYDGDELVQTVHRQWRDRQIARKNKDLKGLRTNQRVGRIASVNIGGGTNTSGPAAQGKPMDPYRIKGIKSRLHVSDITAETIAKGQTDLSDMERDEANFLAWSGGGVGKWGFTLEFNDTRVIHATTDKGHVYTGFMRYTADGTVISQTRLLSTVTYAQGVWGNAGGFGEVIYKDNTNDNDNAHDAA